jgi:hypothetical protein
LKGTAIAFEDEQRRSASALNVAACPARHS